MEDEESQNPSQNLMSNERISHSPVMWPDQNCFGELDSATPSVPQWLQEIERDDKKMLTELASLTQSQLLEKIQALQTFAYQLGINEAKQMRRGTCLQIFESSRRNGHTHLSRDQANRENSAPELPNSSSSTMQT
ncbi:PREDICTED: protein lin-52 homolog [Amphimedon queenslandica]|uniref:Protein lin-52 homolog n=1 Tax=Amphimedon queenslandica TaxID=400682 RepID=A0A1X7V524_AMPQE|nr:PREDICTED: protein lin-52 homolog [Amphimedon queenslandica]|eukprot:XP_011403272.1 PREDICTED: protein lin-52 homolog [Amphimedon queenslandica]